MTNTIVVADLLQNKLLDKLDKELVAKRFANTEYEWQLKSQGTTVRVPIFPDVSWTLWGTAWGTIAQSNFTVTSDTLTVSQVAQINVPIQDVEEVRSNISLREQLTDRMAYALADQYDTHILSVADSGAGNALTDGITGASDVYVAIENMAVALDEDNVSRGDRILFVSPKVASYIRQAGIFDGTESGLAVRTKGYVGMVAWFAIVQTVNLPANKIVGLRNGSIHFVSQMQKMRMVTQTDAMGHNFLWEALYQAKVFSPLADAVVTNTVA